MFGRKNKKTPEQGRARQPRYSGQPARPAFSYYTSRAPEVTPRRPGGRREGGEGATGKGKRQGRLPRIPLAQVPFWLLVALAVVCAAKLLSLSTSPKVIVLDQSAVTATYLQPTDVYAKAAQRLLSSSITNRTKLTADVNGTARALEHEFPELQTVSLTLPLIGNRPIVYVQAARPSVVLQSSQGNYAVNASGVVLARLKSLPAAVPIVVDQSAAAPHAGQQYLPGTTVSFIRTVAYQLSAAKLPVAVYVLPVSSPYELDVRLEGKPYVIKCNLAADALTQSGAAIATIQQLGATTPGSYLDVRVPGRVYYK